jgi:hypothetical protein
VTIDHDIGECGTGGGVKQLLTWRHVDEHIGRPLGWRWAVLGGVCICRPIRTGALRRRLGLNPPLVDAGVLPELTGDLEGIDASLLPPGFFVTGAMHTAVMRAAERDSEFIAGFAAERARLDKSDVMRIRRLAAAQQARLLHYKAKVVPVAIAARRRHRKHAFVDAGLISAIFTDLANLVTIGAETFRRNDRSAFGRQEFG